MDMKRGFYERLTLDYQHTRAIAYSIWFSNVPPAKRPPMHEWWPLSTDGDVIEQEKEEIEEAIAKGLENVKRYKEMEEMQRQMMQNPN